MSRFHGRRIVSYVDALLPTLRAMRLSFSSFLNEQQNKWYERSVDGVKPNEDYVGPSIRPRDDAPRQSEPH